jgi:hypothetical protein
VESHEFNQEYKPRQTNEKKGGQSSIPDTTLEEFLQLLKEKKLVGHLIELLSILREYKHDRIPIKNIRQLSQERHTNDFDLHVNLKISMVT